MRQRAAASDALSVNHGTVQMWYYPDAPPPPDMAFPGWEGPVVVVGNLARKGGRVWRTLFVRFESMA